MNFTKVLSQLNHTNMKNCQVDHKFMSTHTFQKKYKAKNLNQITHQRNPTVINLLKQAKHRYFQDIEADQIQDANVFGYSTFEYFMYFKKNQAKLNKIHKRSIDRQLKKTKSRSRRNNPAQNTETLNSQNRQKSASFLRPKTAIVCRGTPTKKRVHHKLSLNQVQKVATSEHLLPQSLKNQFFTEEIFSFKLSENPKLNNARNNQKSDNFDESQKSQSFQKETRHKKSKYYLEKQINKPGKKLLTSENKSTNFYKSAYNTVNLARRKQANRDVQKISKQKEIFSKGISQHFENLAKKTKQNMGISENSKSGGLGSVVYQRVSNNWRRKEEMVSQNQKIKQKTLHVRQSSSNEQTKIKINQRNFEFSEPLHSQPTKAVQKTCLITQPPIIRQSSSFLLQQLKLSSEICLFHSINSLLLQDSQLSDLRFQYDNNYTPLNHCVFQQTIAKNLNNKLMNQQSTYNNHLKNPSKNKPQLYNFIIVHCLTLEWIKIDNIELKQEAFYHNGNQVSLLLIAQKIMKNNLYNDFVHVMVTTKSSRSSHSHFAYSQQQQALVFETFIHNSDIKYFQTRQVQIQYFKYFLKRFILFDRSITKKQQVQDSVSLILQNEVKTPPQFEQFCQQMKIKGNINILALKNLQAKHYQSTFRSIEINLSKLLTDAIETVMMVKKQLFQGYDWKGVSLTKGARQYKGYHLEHFYI